MSPAVAILTVLLLLSSSAAAQTDAPKCAEQLVKCGDYLNSTKPPETCCRPLKDAVTNDLKCLCSLLNNKELFQAVNINLTQALELPKHCGITAGTSLCDNITSSSGSSPPAGSGSSSDDKTKDDKTGGASGITSMGIYGMLSLLILCMV